MARKEEERRLKELARMLAREQWLAEEKRRKDEARIRAAEESREKVMEEGEVEATADPGTGTHIKMKKRKHAMSGFTILGTLTTVNKGSWKAEDGWVCNPCHRLNRSCVWRQDDKKVHTCYFCQLGKILCTVNPANAEAGPSKKLKMAKGKEKAWETKPELEEDVVAGP